MGATAWFDWAPYHGDPEAALQARRAELFARGDFVDPAVQPGEYLARKLTNWGLPADEPLVRDSIDTANRLERAIRTGDVSGLPQAERGIVERLRQFTAGPGGQTRNRTPADGEEPYGADGERVTSDGPRPNLTPASIDELLDSLGETGTHGLLDIEHASPRPRFGHASPLSATMHRKHFGMLEPSFEAVEIRWPGVADTLATGFARWCLTYESGRPTRIAFIGVTGD